VSVGWPVGLVVVDASAMVEVATGDPGWARRFAAWQDRGSLFVAPGIFAIEVANALLLGLRLDPLDVVGRVRLLLDAGIDLIDGGLAGLAESVELAARHRLTVYDAAYLGLAMDLEGELATTDRALAAAARAEGIAVTEPMDDADPAPPIGGGPAT
jgi:predicted nucleic acid-binding protein